MQKQKEAKTFNNSVRSTQTRPLRGAKNREQGCSSATADFLLEAEKRGSPPKSEKAAAFWEHNKKELGGAGRGGVQPFCEKNQGKLVEMVAIHRIYTRIARWITTRDKSRSQ